MEDAINDICDLSRQQGRYGVTDLGVLGGSGPFEEVVVREGLNPGSFPDRQAATLGRVVVNVIVSIFGDVAGYSRSRVAFNLDSEAIGEIN